MSLFRDIPSFSYLYKILLHGSTVLIYSFDGHLCVTAFVCYYIPTTVDILVLQALKSEYISNSIHQRHTHTRDYYDYSYYSQAPTFLVLNLNHYSFNDYTIFINFQGKNRYKYIYILQERYGLQNRYFHYLRKSTDKILR